jgi:hypothetical protein
MVLWVIDRFNGAMNMLAEVFKIPFRVFLFSW